MILYFYLSQSLPGHPSDLPFFPTPQDGSRNMSLGAAFVQFVASLLTPFLSRKNSEFGGWGGLLHSFYFNCIEEPSRFSIFVFFHLHLVVKASCPFGKVGGRRQHLETNYSLQIENVHLNSKISKKLVCKLDIFQEIEVFSTSCLFHLFSFCVRCSLRSVLSCFLFLMKLSSVWLASIRKLWQLWTLVQKQMRGVMVTSFLVL